MRYSTLLMAAVATLAMAAPITEKRQSLAGLLGLSSNNLDLSNLSGQFSSNSLSNNDILVLLQSFDLNGFNNQFSQFGASFNDQQILQLLLSLQQNQFGVSNFAEFNNVNNVNNLNNGNNGNSFNLGSFANQFNSFFGAGWQQSEIEQLLLQLGLVNNNAFSGLNSGLNSGFNNVNLGASAFGSAIPSAGVVAPVVAPVAAVAAVSSCV